MRERGKPPPVYTLLAGAIYDRKKRMSIARLVNRVRCSHKVLMVKMEHSLTARPPFRLRGLARISPR